MGVLKQPSAFLPLIMSLVVVAVGHPRLRSSGGISPMRGQRPIFQLLIPAEVPIVAYFASTWLPRAPRQALAVLALQIGLIVAIFAAVRSLT